MVEMRTLFHCEFCNLDLRSIRRLGDHVKGYQHIKRHFNYYYDQYYLKTVHYPDITEPEIEDLTALDVLKVADMTIQLVDELKVCLSSMDR